jgi:hypothetical protein
MDYPTISYLEINAHIFFFNDERLVLQLYSFLVVEYGGCNQLAWSYFRFIGSLCCLTLDHCFWIMVAVT